MIELFESGEYRRRTNRLPLDFRIGKCCGDQIGVLTIGSLATTARFAFWAIETSTWRALPTPSSPQSSQPADNAANATAGLSQTVQIVQLRVPRRVGSRSLLRAKANVRGHGSGDPASEQQIPRRPRCFLARDVLRRADRRVYSYTSTDRSDARSERSATERRGSVRDTIGVGWSQGWISKVHAQYLGNGRGRRLHRRREDQPNVQAGRQGLQPRDGQLLLVFARLSAHLESGLQRR